jgi:hypothetical protein
MRNSIFPLNVVGVQRVTQGKGGGIPCSRNTALFVGTMGNRRLLEASKSVHGGKYSTGRYTIRSLASSAVLGKCTGC